MKLTVLNIRVKPEVTYFEVKFLSFCAQKETEIGAFIVSEMTWELRLILTEAIKKKLMLGTMDRPHLHSPKRLSILSAFVINGRRKITRHDLIYK